MINSYKHVDVNSSGGGNGSSWDLTGANAAYNLAEFENFLENSVVAGDVIFIKGGIYNFTGNIDSYSRNGSATSPIAIIGVKSDTTNIGESVTYSDWARSDADRPFFNTGAYQFRFGKYYIVRNISLSGSPTYLLYAGESCVVENCKSYNTYGSSATRYAVYLGNYSSLINCEITAPKVRGTLTVDGNNNILYCFFKDISDTTNGYAIYSDSLRCTVSFCIFNNCYYGIYAVSSYGSTILNNTFYNCNTAVDCSSPYWLVAINNIVEATTSDGFRCGTKTDSNFFWKNHGDDSRCTDMWDNVDETTLFRDYEVSTGDPRFMNPGTNFSLRSDSPALGTGMSIELGVTG